MALAGCSNSWPSVAPRWSLLRIATAKEIARIGISGGGGSETSNVRNLLFDTLVTMNEHLEVVSHLAYEWSRQSETHWLFKLRRGVRFSNGEKCDAHAVAFSITQLANLVPVYAYRNQWGAAWPPSARVIDDDTVVVSTPVPQVILPRLLCRIIITPPIAGSRPEFANFPIGSGPYQLVRWTRGDTIVLKANPGHFAGNPQIDEMWWTSIPNAAARVVALRAGDIDLIWDVPYEREALIEEDPRLKILDYDSIGLAFIAFNFRARRSPIANPLVRRALTFGIDAQGIRDTLMDGKGEISRGPAPSQVIGAVDAGGYPSRDVAKCKAMLASEGYSDGMSLNLIYEAGNFQHEEDVCGAIVAQLAECGVRVTFEDLPPGGMQERRFKEDWDLAPNSVPGSFTGESSYHYYQLKSQQGFFDQRVEAILDGATNLQGAPRLAALQQSMRQMWAATPYLWSLSIARSFGTINRLEGTTYVPINWLKLTNAKLVADPRSNAA